MVETVSVLRLCVPKIEGDSASLELSPSRMSEWLDSLPLAAVDDAATKVRDALAKMNRSRVPTEQRYQIMEAIRERATAIDAAMKKQREKSAFQPTARNRALAALHQSMLEEIAHGYKRILADLLQSGEPGRVPKAMVVAAHRTIDALTHVLLEAYVSYSPEPEHTWGEIHRIYRFASQARIHTKSVPGGERDDSIDRAYRMLILLYLANPYHLMQGEVYSLYSQLGQWVDGCRLQPVQSGAELAGQLYIDPEQDRPPLYAPSNMPAKPLAALLVDVTEASAHVNQPIEALELKRREKNGLTLIDRMKRDTLVRLKHAWEARRERSFQRAPQNIDIEVVVGLSGCHHYVSHEANFIPEAHELRMTGEAGKQQAKNLSLMSDHQEEWSTNAGMQMSLRSSRFEATDIGGPDAWDSIFETKSQTIEKTLDYEDQFRQKFALTTWQQHDISDGGISISLGDAEPSSAIRVGELISYRRAGNADAPWSIGAVRWMQFLPGRGLSLGVRKLSDNAVALGGRCVEGTGAGGEYFRVLLTEPIDAGDASSLLVPAAIYDVGSLILAVDEDEIRHLRLTELTDTTRSFSRFSYSLDAPPRMKIPMKASSSFSPF